MAASTRMICPVTSVSDPLLLYLPTGYPVSLSLSQVYTPSYHPVNPRDLVPNSYIEVIFTNSTQYGIFLKTTRKDSISSLGVQALEASFESYSQICKGTELINALLAYMEQAVMRNDTSIGKPMEKYQFGAQIEYLFKNLMQNFTINTVNSLIDSLDSIKSENFGRMEVVEGELTQLQLQFYQQNGHLVPYKVIKPDKIDQKDWLMHAISSIFDVIIEKIEISGAKKYYYPNSLSVFSPVITLYGDVWLQSKSVLHCGKALNHLNLSVNLFHGLMEMYEIREAVRKMTNIEEMKRVREVAEEMEKRFAEMWREVEGKKGEVDGVMQEFVEVLRGGKGMVKVIDERVTCATKGCGKPSTHYFECNFGICADCITDRLESKTLFCGHCNIVLQPQNSTYKMFPPLTPQEKALALVSQSTLVCSKCSTKQKTGHWPIGVKLKPRVYQLECWDTLCSECLELCVRDGSGTCPKCMLYVDIHEDEVLKATVQCGACSQWKLVMREFPTVKCNGHRICIQCISQMKHITYCYVCQREYSATEQGILGSFSALQCKQCKEQVRRAQIIYNENVQCECILCVKCYKGMKKKSMDIMTCPGCQGRQIGQKILLRSYFDVLNRVQNTEFEEFEGYQKAADERNKNFEECKICYEPLLSELTKVYVGRCLHTFHTQCLADTVNEAVKNILVRNLVNPTVKCPRQSCREEVSAVYLTGHRALIPQELYDRLQEHAIRQTHREFICSQCNQKDFIEKELEHFACAHCHSDLCVTCYGQWEVGHNAKVCEFNRIERIIRERFVETKDCQVCKGTGINPGQAPDVPKRDSCSNCTYSQCPGCKLPYLKDNHCDHVICLNPDCKAVFCFPCACLRLPTTEHCNSYHRRQCPNFPQDETPAQTQKILKGEKMKDKCPECKRLGRRCDPPPDLARIRRFALTEY